MKKKKFDTVNHLGRIISITPDSISVKIETKSLCASCHAKGACTAADKADKIVDVTNSGTETYEVGELVNVVMQRSLGLRAVFISYVVPLFILLFLLLTLSVAGVSELNSGLLSLCGVGVYYGILFLMRKKITHDFIFRIEKQ